MFVRQFVGKLDGTGAENSYVFSQRSAGLMLTRLKPR
jgi:hypothetical protein